jgi:hypothetical protein
MVAEEVMWLAPAEVVIDFIEQATKISRRQFIYIGHLKIHGQLNFVIVAVHLGKF